MSLQAQINILGKSMFFRDLWNGYLLKPLCVIFLVSSPGKSKCALLVTYNTLVILSYSSNVPKWTGFCCVCLYEREKPASAIWKKCWQMFGALNPPCPCDWCTSLNKGTATLCLVFLYISLCIFAHLFLLLLGVRWMTSRILIFLKKKDSKMGLTPLSFTRVEIHIKWSKGFVSLVRRICPQPLRS